MFFIMALGLFSAVAFADLPCDGSLLSDEALIDRHRSGDEQAFSALFQRYQARFTNYFRRRVPPGTDPEDAVQMTFIRIYRNLPVFDRARGQFEMWSLAIARNLLISLHRNRRAVGDAIPPAALAIEDEDEEPFADFAGWREQLRTVILFESWQDRRVFELRSQGVPYDQISAELGVSGPALRRRFSRMIARLRARQSEEK